VVFGSGPQAAREGMLFVIYQHCHAILPRAARCERLRNCVSEPGICNNLRDQSCADVRCPRASAPNWRRRRRHQQLPAV